MSSYDDVAMQPAYSERGRAMARALAVLAVVAQIVAGVVTAMRENDRSFLVFYAASALIIGVACFRIVPEIAGFAARPEPFAARWHSWVARASALYFVRIGWGLYTDWRGSNLKWSEWSFYLVVFIFVFFVLGAVYRAGAPGAPMSPAFAPVQRVLRGFAAPVRWVLAHIPARVASRLGALLVLCTLFMLISAEIGCGTRNMYRGYEVLQPGHMWITAANASDKFTHVLSSVVGKSGYVVLLAVAVITLLTSFARRSDGRVVHRLATATGAGLMAIVADLVCYWFRPVYVEIPILIVLVGGSVYCLAQRGRAWPLQRALLIVVWIPLIFSASWLAGIALANNIYGFVLLLFAAALMWWGQLEELRGLELASGGTQTAGAAAGKK